MIFSRSKLSPSTTFYVIGDTGTQHTLYFKRHAVSHRKVWTCDCGDFIHRRFFKGEFCKHVVFAQYRIAEEQAMTAGVSEPVLPAAIPAIPNARAVIDGLVSFLNTASYEDSQRVWDIITALRGPDNGMDRLKGDTTAVVRRMIGLTSNGSVRNFAIVADAAHRALGLFELSAARNGGTLEAENAITAKFSQAQPHFVHHYTRALASLTKLGY